MAADFMPQRDPQRQPLPLHAAAQFPVRSANGIVRARKKRRADGVGDRREPAWCGS